MFNTGDVGLFLGMDVGKAAHHGHGLTPAGKKVFDKPMPNHEGDAPASRFLGILRTDPSAPSFTPDPAAVAEWVRDGLASGRYLGGEHLRPVQDATLVRRRGGELWPGSRDYLP
jgi:hypothetical protein